MQIYVINFQLTEKIKECLLRDRNESEGPQVCCFEEQEEAHFAFMRQRSAQVKDRNDVLRTVRRIFVHIGFSTNINDNAQLTHFIIFHEY